MTSTLGSVNIVGVDPSLNGTCLFNGEEFAHLTHGLTGVPRMRFVLGETMRHLAEWDTDIVMLEQFAFSRAQHAHEKGGLGWVLRLAMLDAGYVVYTVLPNKRAMFATGRGNAKKVEVVSKVSAKTGIEFPSDDHCDAFLLWCMGREMRGEAHRLGKLPQLNARAMEHIELLEG